MRLSVTRIILSVLGYRITGLLYQLFVRFVYTDNWAQRIIRTLRKQVKELERANRRMKEENEFLAEAMRAIHNEDLCNGRRRMRQADAPGAVSGPTRRGPYPRRTVPSLGIRTDIDKISVPNEKGNFGQYSWMK